MNFYRRFLFISGISIAATILTACGGGGDSSKETTGSAPDTPTLSVPTPLTSRPGDGAKSTAQQTISDFSSTRFSVTSTATGSLVSQTFPASVAVDFPPTIHLSDTKVSPAWAAGWTGKGVLIAVVDDFQTSIASASLDLPLLMRQYQTQQGNTMQASYTTTFRISKSITHGEIVASIAGGITSGREFDSVSLISASLTGCTIVNVTTFAPLCDPGYSARDSFTNDHRSTAGVAVESLVARNSVELGPVSDVAAQLIKLQSHIDNAAGASVMNLSVGRDIPFGNLSFADVMSQVQKTPLTKPVASVIVVAAGNSGSACSQSNLSGCNAWAVSMSFQTETRQSTIVAGSLSGTGSSENIATRSTRAGALAERFLLASGESGYNGIEGTSFAAPRIAGAAAILRQKYPSLTAKQAADILLLSANKDINNDGSPDFSGVSAIYGRGKLDLNAALSLANSLANP